MHVSGHASAGELVYCYNILEPANVLPVHGESRHLRANADLAIRTGVPRDRVLIAENGSVIDLRDGVASITGRVPIELIYVDASTVGGVTEDSLAERRLLGSEGVLTVIAIVDPDTGLLVDDVDFIGRGFAHTADDFKKLGRALNGALERESDKRVASREQIETRLVHETTRWAKQNLSRQPLVVPVVVDG